MAIRGATFGLVLTAALLMRPPCAIADPALTNHTSPTRTAPDTRIKQKQKQKQKLTQRILQKATLYTVNLPILSHANTHIANETPIISRLRTIQYSTARPQVEVDPEKQLQLLSEDQPFEITLQDNLKLEWQVKSYTSRDDDFDVGMKLGLRYRF